jgi:hypothetical protein
MVATDRHAGERRDGVNALSEGCWIGPTANCSKDDHS